MEVVGMEGEAGRGGWEGSTLPLTLVLPDRERRWLVGGLGRGGVVGRYGRRSVRTAVGAIGKGYLGERYQRGEGIVRREMGFGFCSPYLKLAGCLDTVYRTSTDLVQVPIKALLQGYNALVEVG